MTTHSDSILCIPPKKYVSSNSTLTPGIIVEKPCSSDRYRGAGL